MNPAWAVLVLAGLFEIVWAVALRQSAGFTRPVPAVIVGVAAFASFWLLSRAMIGLPIGTAYAVWVGIGAVGVAVIGIIGFAEPAGLTRLAGLALVIAGIGLLKIG